MTQNELVAVLVESGWERDEEGDLRNLDCVVMLHGDGKQVALTHRAIYPRGVVVSAEEAATWATSPAPEALEDVFRGRPFVRVG